MTTTTEAPTRAELRDHLVLTRLAGKVATPRENNLQNFLRMSRREPLHLFGLRPTGPWTGWTRWRTGSAGPRPGGSG